jgi:hypothetical protein
MNNPYDFHESAALITKLVDLTRNGKIEWSQGLKPLISFDEIDRYYAIVEGNLEVQVWVSKKAAGFRLIERAREQSESPVPPLMPSPRNFIPLGLPNITERELIAISLSHEEGPSRGQIYIKLMALLELARRSVDKVEPKVDRVKQYLDKLAV